jgi:hypothetical protein
LGQLLVQMRPTKSKKAMMLSVMAAPANPWPSVMAWAEMVAGIRLASGGPMGPVGTSPVVGGALLGAAMVAGVEKKKTSSALEERVERH